MTGMDDQAQTSGGPPPPPPPAIYGDTSPGRSDSEEEDEGRRYDGDDDDPFGGFGPGHGSGLSTTLRALSGIMSSSGRIRDLVNGLRQKEDPTMVALQLQELCEILLVSNEENLSGHFSPDSLVKELVILMQPPWTDEIMLLACRCLANLMEALPASVANVVYGGAVPILCSKLLEIQYIDLAEQSLSTLEKVSAEYPSAIVREGGLTACLSYLDFFATSTQRTAVTTAANCCRNLPDDTFDVIKDVMPILLNVLGSNDQRVVEQGSLCVCGIVESFKNQSRKLEALVNVDLLRAVLRLLVPGTTNLIGPSIHTQFLRVLAFTAHASPRLSADLFKLNVVETLYQILTGVSPPSGTDDVASKLDSVVIMQALIHRPRDQILETLNVICELLPALRKAPEGPSANMMEMAPVPQLMSPASSAVKTHKSSNEKRIELLDECKDEVRHFASILFPTLTDAFSSTVNLTVRQKVLTAQLKMLSNLDVQILVEALKSVPYSSFLASILSQQDHSSLVIMGLQATELLLSRLDDVYRYQLYREGVIAEITKLATEEEEEPLTTVSGVDDSQANHEAGQDVAPRPESDHSSNETSDQDDSDDDEDEDHDSSDDENEENENEAHADDISASPVSSRGSTMSIDGPPPHIMSEMVSMKSRIREAAKKFLETHETEKQSKAMKKKATNILSALSSLAEELQCHYLQPSSGGLCPEHGLELFGRLVDFFDTDMLESVTSAELLQSGLVRVLVDIFSNPDESLARAAHAAFLQVFMGRTTNKLKLGSADSPATPFSVMIHKLQDLLSRAEHFEVITVHNNSFESNRSSAVSMLAKQIRLRLVADDEPDIPRPLRNIVVSIHAIATFQSLEEYLRPRMIIPSDRPRGGSSRRDALSRLAAMAGARSSIPPMPPSASRRPPAPGGGGLAERPVGASTPSTSTPAPPSQPSASSSRQHRKSKIRPQAEHPPAPETPASASREKGTLRRSRRHAGASETPPPRPPPDSDDDLRNALECADERPLSDDDDELGEGSALDEIVGDLDEDMDDEAVPDPSAVNLEVASTGKVTARREDGTRVPTPAHASTAPRPPPGRASPSQNNSSRLQTPPAMSSQGSGSSNRMSYSAAIQSTPKDWHVEFSLDGKPVSYDTTIYRAVHRAAVLGEDHGGRSVWSQVHTVKFKRVPGPPPAPESTASFASTSDSTSETGLDGIPASLAKNPTAASILRLLRILHDLNANPDDVLAENSDTIRLNMEPLSHFVNTKLTAKLNRQLEEPLIVASNCLPTWSEDLARLFPFLFPFETRHLFLQSTSFGYARSMARWQNAQSTEETRRDRRDERPFLGRLQRQKVRIGRPKILESALKVMELYGSSQSVLEVEYFDEVGTGLGPTLEFYSTISTEFAKKKLKLWREVDSNDSDEFVYGETGLFPRPMSDEEASSDNGERVLQLFASLGKFVARSMLDSRIIDINFNPIFFRIADGPSGAGVKPSLGAVKNVDPGLARSLKAIKRFALVKKEVDEDPERTPAQKVADTEAIVIDGSKIDDLCLDFTLPGYPDIELVPNGAQVRVTIANVDEYLEKVIDMTLFSGVRRQIDAFRSGFSAVFPYSALSAFTPDELVSLFGRIDEDWSLESKFRVPAQLIYWMDANINTALMDSVKADHGYNMDSKSFKNLLYLMSQLDKDQRRHFLQFTTGSPKLPIGGKLPNLTAK